MRGCVSLESELQENKQLRVWNFCCGQRRDNGTGTRGVLRGPRGPKKEEKTYFSPFIINHDIFGFYKYFFPCHLKQIFWSENRNIFLPEDFEILSRRLIFSYNHIKFISGLLRISQIRKNSCKPINDELNIAKPLNK